jgi:NAD(P)-dependent dehydrogenase (short-subunit alcohol dehydrogenase family)
VTASATPSALFALDGTVAVVTGASSGLGAAIARTLAGAGASVALVARRRDRLDALASETGGIAVAADLLDDAALDRVMPEVVDRIGAPSVLVNAAGAILGSARAEDESPEAIRRTLDLNLVAPLRLAQAVHPHLVAAGGGAIVNISSISGHVGIPGIPQASYAASKAGLSGLTCELAVQWARHRIRVNTVAPGFFRSEITADLYDSEKGSAWLRRGTLLPDEGRTEDVVGAVLWLVSDAGRYTTGQTIVVDGGWTAR